ncbi:carbamate kinase [Staphylococcus simiae]|uniref:Carbamate kinase n=1 Tax=Staphylococcus simiae CCM 7213 = CCUG 51256 TaxID=911238 RepID=G5JLY2_9STAP|nr:carbamate kinase [Staphylococcus simiae]EHJ06811.1 carbamate kinase [Staphylococcus simiae CCM 7213 = CCUG 51256]PNZ13868.1 carbamate kinase [Staphylococcus simiae]SNV59705.1 carbamate kinase [Staphylococcus simiae]
MGKNIVLALGGNAILQPKQEATYQNQYNNVYSAARRMAELKKVGHNIVITHGNGPQVGNIITQNEIAKDYVEPLPIYACNAESQGFIGFMLEKALKNHLNDMRIDSNVVSLLTMTEVDKDDKAFDNPTKPIGVFFDKEEAEALERQYGYVMSEDAGRGYRRVVPSPEPLVIHGVEQIKTLIEHQAIVISSGGGGIPVYKDAKGDIQGVEAVIDKDRSGLKLAEQVDADVFMMLTDVSNVYINYGKMNEEKLETITVSQAKQYVDEGQFPAGSMLPKMEAAIRFAESGKEAIICSLDDAIEAAEGKAGTRVVAD